MHWARLVRVFVKCLIISLMFIHFIPDHPRPDSMHDAHIRLDQPNAEPKEPKQKQDKESNDSLLSLVYQDMVQGMGQEEERRISTEK